MTYADLVLSKIRENHTAVYLVNTGWQGDGKRFPLAVTREIVRWILNDTTPLNNYDVLPVFELRVPQSIPGVESSFLDPRSNFAHVEEWEERAHKLADDFITNFEKYDDLDNYRWIKKGGPLSTIVS
jgi:phosphoenolpyruvate carboxykinase (ATP)